MLATRLHPGLSTEPVAQDGDALCLLPVTGRVTWAVSWEDSSPRSSGAPGSDAVLLCNLTRDGRGLVSYFHPSP